MQGSAQAVGSPPDGGNGTLTRIRLDRFTAFGRLDLALTRLADGGSAGAASWLTRRGRRG